MRTSLAAVLLLAIPAMAADPAAELARAGRRLGDGNAHEAAFTQSFTAAGFSHPRVEKGTVRLQAPGLLRFAYGGSGNLFTFDGREVRFYTPGSRQLLIRPLSPAERAELPLVFLESPEALSRLYTLSDAGGRIVLTPREADSPVRWIRVSLAGDGFPASLEYATAEGDRTEFAFGPFSQRPPRPASDYAPAPPPGTRIVGDVQPD